jgi:hypothetical protein
VLASSTRPTELLSASFHHRLRSLALYSLGLSQLLVVLMPFRRGQVPNSYLLKRVIAGLHRPNGILRPRNFDVVERFKRASWNGHLGANHVNGRWKVAFLRRRFCDCS